MVDFPQTVAIPSSYGPGLADFSAIANAPNTYYQGVFNKQQEQLNQAKLEQMKQQTDLAKAFAGGLPTDPQTGGIDYRKAAAILAAKGDIGGAVSLLQNQPAPMSPMLGGMPSGGVSPPNAPGPVSSTPSPSPQAASLPNTIGNTVLALAAGVGAPDAVAQNIARAVGVSPTVPLSNAQQARASSLLKAYAGRQSAAGLQRLQNAIFGQESGYGSNSQTSVTGARGPMQIEPSTFKQYASAGENIDSAADNRTVGNRILSDYWKRYSGDPARAAVAYFSGPGNVAPTGSPTPWKKDRADPTGKTTSSYVEDVLRKMGIGQLRQAMEPANPRVASTFSALSPSDAALPPSANAATPRATVSSKAVSPPQSPPTASPAAVTPQPQQPYQQPRQMTPQQPLVPQIPLPVDPRTGMPFTNPQEAIVGIDQEIARLSRYPGAQGRGQIAALEDMRSRIAAMSTPVQVGNALLDPRTGREIYRAPLFERSQTGQLVGLENAEREARGEAPMTAQEEISFIQGVRPPRSAPAMAVEAFKQDFQRRNGRAPTADEITKFASDYSRQQSYGRAAGTQGARVENAANEVVQLIPQAIEASKTVPRGSWVPFNQLVQKWDQGTSDPAYNDFMMANFSLLNAYTRAMNPQGVPRIQERLEQHALGVLSTATDEKSYETQVRRLWKEVQASKVATAETAKGVTPGNINAPVPGLDTEQGGTTAGGLQWSVVQP